MKEKILEKLEIYFKEKYFCTILDVNKNKFFGFIQDLSDKQLILKNDKNPNLEVLIPINQISVVMASKPELEKQNNNFVDLEKKFPDTKIDEEN
jgi:hypothetical protein